MGDPIPKYLCATTPIRMQKKELLEQGQKLYDEASHQASNGMHRLAIDLFNQSIEIYRQAKDDPWIVFVQHEKLHSLTSLSKSKEVFELIEDIIPIYVSQENYKGLSLLFANKGIYQLQIQEFQAGLDALRTADSICIHENINENKGYIYSSISRIHLAQNSYIEAYLFLEKALLCYSQELDNQEWAWCHHQIGYCLGQLHQVNKAEIYLETAYKSFLKCGDFQSATSAMEDLRKIYLTTDQAHKAKDLEPVMIQTGKSINRRKA